MNAYAGIGSRGTPPTVERAIARIAVMFSVADWTLRSGGADGADSMFERHHTGPAEIYLPWPGFNGNASPLKRATPKAYEIAAHHHPAWDRLTPDARMLHARNVHQVLGRDCETPAQVVVCWTPDGRMVGGTAQAMRIACAREIKIVNIASYGGLLLPMLYDRIAEIVGE